MLLTFHLPRMRFGWRKRCLVSLCDHQTGTTVPSQKAALSFEQVSVEGQGICRRKHSLVSDAQFCALLSSDPRVMADHHKQMCPCEICAALSDLQSALNMFRVKHVTQLKKKWMDLPEGTTQVAQRRR